RSVACPGPTVAGLDRPGPHPPPRCRRPPGRGGTGALGFAPPLVRHAVGSVPAFGGTGAGRGDGGSGPRRKSGSGRKKENGGSGGRGRRGRGRRGQWSGRGGEYGHRGRRGG